jgi:hypothetical protein
MSELPDRPDIDQLRRRARELLRAATSGDPHALGRLRAVSQRVTLSAAHLALAREHGFPSWPALRTAVKRRRRLSTAAAQSPYGDAGEQAYPDAPEERWSFGTATTLERTATTLETAEGVLSPVVLIVGPGHAILDARLMPPEQGEHRPEWPGREHTHEERVHTALAVMAAQARTPGFDDVIVTDDRGTRYTLRVVLMSTPSGNSGQVREPTSLLLSLDPVPARECRWLELRVQDGPATRLLPSARPPVRVGRPAAASASPAELELSQLALSVIGLRLTGIGQGAGYEGLVSRRCSAALARMAQIRQSGELDPASELPDQLVRLCSSLTGGHSTHGLALAPGWSGMLDAAQRTDGPRQHMDIPAVLPPMNGAVVQLDSLVSEPESWYVYLRTRPGWWAYSEDRRRKWAAVSVDAEDNVGGVYLSTFGGSSDHDDHADVTLRFLPRLDPLARALKLTFSAAGEQVAVEVRLAPTVASEP